MGLIKVSFVSGSRTYYEVEVSGSNTSFEGSHEEWRWSDVSALLEKVNQAAARPLEVMFVHFPVGLLERLEEGMSDLAALAAVKAGPRRVKRATESAGKLRCVKCDQTIRATAGEHLDFGDGTGQHIVCPAPRF